MQLFSLFRFFAGIATLFPVRLALGRIRVQNGAALRRSVESNQPGLLTGFRREARKMS